MKDQPYGDIQEGQSDPPRPDAPAATPTADTTELSAPVTWALAYAARGWFVFPCRLDKSPYTDHGYLDATTDADCIRTWWTKLPDAQIGVACGASRLVVVDTDIDPEKGKDGEEELRAFLGPNPERCALIARTPRGGRHLVYADPENRFGLAQNVGSSKAIDVRAVGGYIIVPSSASPGRVWVEGDPLDGDDPAPPPDHLLPLLPPAKTSSGCRESGSMQPAGTVDDQRLAEVRSALSAVPANLKRLVSGGEHWLGMIWAAHDALCADERGAELVEEWSATTDIAGQHKPGEAWRIYATARLPVYLKILEPITCATLFHAAQQRGWKWDRGAAADADLAAVVEVASKEPPRAPRQPDRDLFPLDLIAGDDLLMRIVQDIVATAILPQPALALGAAICTVGTMLGRKVSDPRGTRTNVYTVNVGTSGSGKNHPLSYCVDYLNEVDPRLNGPREFKSDSGVYAVLATWPVQCALIDEFGLTLQATTEANAPAHLRGINKALLELFTASHRTVQAAAYADHKVNPRTPIVEPCLSVAGFTTPATLFMALSTRNVADGLLGRCLMFEIDDVPPKPRKRHHKDGAKSHRSGKPSTDIVQLGKQLLAGLAPPGDLAFLDGMPGHPASCRIYHFTDEAADYIDEEVIPEEEQHRGDLSALWKRLEEHVVKLALIRASSAHPTDEVIGLEFTRWAHRLVSWCIRRLERAFEAHAADSDVERETLRVQRLIDDAGAGGLTASHVSRKTQWLHRKERNDILATLVEGGRITIEDGISERAKPVRIYVSTKFREGGEG